MSVLPHLGDQHARPAPESPFRRRHRVGQSRPAGIVGIGAAIDAADRPGLRVEAAEDVLHRRRNLAERRTGSRACHGQFEKVAASRSPLAQGIERRPDGLGVAPGLTLSIRATCASRTAWLSTSRILDRRFGLQPIAVDADDHVLAAIDPSGFRRRRFLDHRLRPAGRDGLRHPPSLRMRSMSAHAPSTSALVRLST